jgi:hypothetical protein
LHRVVLNLDAIIGCLSSQSTNKVDSTRLWPNPETYPVYSRYVFSYSAKLAELEIAYREACRRWILADTSLLSAKRDT